MWADFGYARDHGFVWPMCPRFYLEKSNPSAAHEAVRLVTMVRAAGDPILSAQYEGPMTPREVEVYRLIRRFDARQAKEARDVERELARRTRELSHGQR